jgi:glycosyltransferase involved in cell wall biosynthesis
VRVSLIITTYNWPAALDLVLLAVSRQTVLPDEVIIGDDGSGLETREVVRKWQAKLGTPLRHVWQPDEGFRLARARNLAIAASSGDYVVMLDGDMVPQPSFIEDHKNAARPGAFAQGVRALTDAAGATRMLEQQQPFLSFFAPGVSRRRHLVRLPLLSKCLRWSRNHFNCIRGANQAYWRRHLLAVNGFDERMVGWGYDDCEIAARLYHLGIDRFDLRFGGLAVHLWHPRRQPLEGDPTQAIFLDTLARRTTRCIYGMDQHSTSRAALM